VDEAVRRLEHLHPAVDDDVPARARAHLHRHAGVQRAGAVQPRVEHGALGFALLGQFAPHPLDVGLDEDAEHRVFGSDVVSHACVSSCVMKPCVMKP